LTIFYYSVTDQDYDRVLDIFVRANEGGTKLSKSDLLLSMVTAKWGDFNAREEIYGFVDHLNGELSRKNNLDKDFIMKTCLVLCDLPVRYAVENFNNKNLEHIYSNWKPIKGAIEAGVRLVNSFGIDRDTLTSQNALIPIIYYLYRCPGISFLGSSSFETSNARKMRTWLLMALLNNAFGAQSDTALTEVRKAIQEQVALSKEFPISAVNSALSKIHKPTSFSDETLDKVLSLTYGGRDTFFALSLLYDKSDWGSATFHQDHIFPRALFTPQKLKALGIDDVEGYRQLADRIGNLQLLMSYENEEKSGKDFETWLKTRHATYRGTHLIPDAPDLYGLNHFEEFVAAREALIGERLKLVLSPVA
jgi:hypothetical protein